MTLSEIVARRARDYGLDTPEAMAEATGMSVQQARLMMLGKLDGFGLRARRGLVKGLDIDPGVIERSVRR